MGEITVHTAHTLKWLWYRLIEFIAEALHVVVRGRTTVCEYEVMMRLFWCAIGIDVSIMERRNSKDDTALLNDLTPIFWRTFRIEDYCPYSFLDIPALFSVLGRILGVLGGFFGVFYRFCVVFVSPRKTYFKVYEREKKKSLFVPKNNLLDSIE